MVDLNYPEAVLYLLASLASPGHWHLAGKQWPTKPTDTWDLHMGLVLPYCNSALLIIVVYCLFVCAVVSMAKSISEEILTKDQQATFKALSHTSE